MPLSERRCEPCEGKVPLLEAREAEALLAEVPAWRIDHGKLVRLLVQRDFVSTIALVQRIADVAEREQHHPDLRIFGWNKLEIAIFTHALDGLSRNDFVLAAKIDALLAG